MNLGNGSRLEKQRRVVTAASKLATVAAFTLSICGVRCTVPQSRPMEVNAQEIQKSIVAQNNPRRRHRIGCGWETVR